MKKFIFIFVIFFSKSLYSQNSRDLTIKKINKFLNLHSINIQSGKAITNSTVFYNIKEELLDIDGAQIPLREVKVFYKTCLIDRNCVSFGCLESNNCILNSNGEIHTGFGIAFLTKKNCYDFIELVNQLKK